VIADSARQQEKEPDKARVMRFDGQANRHAKNACPHKSLFQEAPNGHHAKADHQSGRVAGAKDTLAVDQQNADQKEREIGRVPGSKTPGQEGGQDKDSGSEDYPQPMRRPPRH
jgi:hypothetical protein